MFTFISSKATATASIKMYEAILNVLENPW